MNIFKFVGTSFHFHKWDYVPAVYADAQNHILAIPKELGYRTCIICGEKQIERKHCLGLNPPKYVIYWEKSTSIIVDELKEPGHIEDLQD